MIYKINKEYIKIDCKLPEYKKNITDKLSMFELVNDNENKEVKNQIIFQKKITQTIRNNNIFNIKGYLQKTDIYPLIYNYLSHFINDETNLLIHSTLISKNNNGILILGNFGQGKTMLANYLELNDYEINSSDQTWIRITNKGLQSIKGSRQLIYNSNYSLMPKENCSKNIIIKEIILLYGLCENGKYFEKNIDIESHYIKNIYQFASWHSSIPLLTNNELLFDSNSKTLLFLKQLWEKNIPLKIVKGSSENILLNIKL